ncbi:DUF2716 domain-containing protein [Nocardioides marmoriginsengisoli]|uniref:DUF2716 domain-containing protein n=2 Tax=Nocardioides marmoriginsengisoli TaxID=661483 RepID=A0A3N0CDA1_9ACTN|nr:DUF2716 domain-containing protein [Nocardioides marmoriginsengisoli]
MSNDGTPALFDARGFVTVDDSVPSDWRVEVSDQGTILGPAEFLNPGFWEAYFDLNEAAVAVFKQRHPQNAWVELSDSEYRWAWSNFETRFEFRAGMSPDTWPAIREPEHSATFDLAPVFDREGPTFAAGESSINAEALRAFVTALPGQTLLALDWQHPAYRFAPEDLSYSPNPTWAIPVFPNGDYYAFFTDDFSSGVFGHPWERSLCVIGQPLLETLGASLETWLPVLRRGEWNDWSSR